MKCLNPTNTDFLNCNFQILPNQNFTARFIGVQMLDFQGLKRAMYVLPKFYTKRD